MASRKVRQLTLSAAFVVGQALGCATTVNEEALFKDPKLEFRFGINRSDLLAIPSEFNSPDDFGHWIFWGEADRLFGAGRQNFVEFLYPETNGVLTLYRESSFVGAVLFKIINRGTQIEIIGIARKTHVALLELGPLLSRPFLEENSIPFGFRRAPDSVTIQIADREIEQWSSLLQNGYQITSIENGEAFRLTKHRKGLGD